MPWISFDFPTTKRRRTSWVFTHTVAEKRELIYRCRSIIGVCFEKNEEASNKSVQATAGERSGSNRQLQVSRA
jgi:hypothetical protein